MLQYLRLENFASEFKDFKIKYDNKKSSIFYCKNDTTGENFRDYVIKREEIEYIIKFIDFFIKNSSTYCWDFNSMCKNPNIPTDIEIGVTIEGSKYLYYLSYSGNTGEIISENLSINDKVVVSRFYEAPKFIINEIVSDMYYSFGCTNFKAPTILLFTESGKKFLDYIKNIIIFKELLSDFYGGFLEELEKLDKTYNIDSRKIIASMLSSFGFDYKEIDKYGNFITGNFKFSYNNVGSGVKRLSRLLPYLYISKERGYPVIIKIFNSSFHPLLSKKLLNWYLEGKDPQIISIITYPES